MFSKTIIATVLAAVANGHMLMNTPAPYSSPALHNGPLQADGSDFPCQLTSGTSLMAGSASNTFALGSEQALKFTGEAVHGGGSCQISLTYDTAPSASSTWKVIRSIEGGCPAEGQSGNMGADASAADPYTYNFTVPTDIPTGSVTLAWTWFNKIGNREMYMNCAPVTLTGTSGTQAAYDSLPDMFVANIGDDCGTVDSTDLLFPNPGSDVVQLNGATSAFSKPTGTGCQVAGASPAAAKSTGGAATTAALSLSLGVTIAGGAAATKSSTAAAAADTGITGAVFITVATDGAAGATSTPVAAVKTTSTPVVAASLSTTAAGTKSAAAETTAALETAKSVAAGTTKSAAATTFATAAATAAATASSSSATSGTEQTAGSACSPEGTWNCMGSSYQQCASGTWSVVMALADGTECTVGKAATLSLAAIDGKKKRFAMRFRA